MPKRMKEDQTMTTVTAEDQGITTGNDEATTPSAEDQEALKQIAEDAKRVLAAKGMLTYKQAAQYTGKNDSQIRTAVKTHEAFKPEGAVESREIEGTDFKVTYISVGAIDSWLAAQAAKGKAGVSRTKKDGKKYFVIVKAEDFDRINSLLLANGGYRLEAAYQAGSKAKATTEGASPVVNEGASSTDAEVTMDQLFNQETVQA